MNEQGFGIYVGSKIPQILKNAVNKAVESGNYLNSSDFVRDAIKEKLQREGFLVYTEQANQGF
jgi:Arc/MetJ-type ribon-helix-helix transcriptional regulator